VNEILITLNERLISMCDVRTMSYMTKQSVGFVCHAPFKSCNWNRTEIYNSVEASCYVETWSANAICQGIRGPSGWGGTVYCVYLYGVHV